MEFHEIVTIFAHQAASFNVVQLAGLGPWAGVMSIIFGLIGTPIMFDDQRRAAVSREPFGNSMEALFWRWDVERASRRTARRWVLYPSFAFAALMFNGI